jgi:hypothetical protein
MKLDQTQAQARAQTLAYLTAANMLLSKPLTIKDVVKK